MSNVLAQTVITGVDSVNALLSLLDNITDLPIDPPSLYLDVEGVELRRHSSIFIVSYSNCFDLAAKTSLLFILGSCPSG